MSPAGYSQTPLATKLGVKAGQRLWRKAMPQSVADEIAAEVPEAVYDEYLRPDLDLAHLFTASRRELADTLAVLRPLLAPAGTIWVSWPKKASKVPTDITEDTIREECFPLGLVDVKVCAVDATWSGLKLVIRKALRG